MFVFCVGLQIFGVYFVEIVEGFCVKVFKFKKVVEKVRVDWLENWLSFVVCKGLFYVDVWEQVKWFEDGGKIMWEFDFVVFIDKIVLIFEVKFVKISGVVCWGVIRSLKEVLDDFVVLFLEQFL